MSWKQLRSPMHDELRRLLKERRQAAGLTQKQLGDRLGWDQKTVSDIEVGSHRVTVIELIEIAEAIGFDAPAAVRRVIKTKEEPPKSES
jgi:transcriptional regulator with XRE-family HTH domain